MSALCLTAGQLWQDRCKCALRIPKVGRRPLEQVPGLGPDGRLGVLLEDGGEVAGNGDGLGGQAGAAQAWHLDLLTWMGQEH